MKAVFMQGLLQMTPQAVMQLDQVRIVVITAGLVGNGVVFVIAQYQAGGSGIHHPSHQMHGGANLAATVNDVPDKHRLALRMMPAPRTLAVAEFFQQQAQGIRATVHVANDVVTADLPGWMHQRISLQPSLERQAS